MSRIGNSPIIIPSGVIIEKDGGSIVVNGPKGSLSLNVGPEIKVEIQDSQIILKRRTEEKNIKALHGLTRSLIANMLKGVTDGWAKFLELIGVGFRAQIDGSKLTLNIGFSHPVEVLAPPGILFEVTDNTKIKVSGIDKQLVGQTAANIRKIKLPDVYKGKGVRYEGEYVRKKAGKAAKAGAVGVGGAKL